MNEDVEIIEPQDNWEKEFPVLTKLAHVKVPVQQMIINGQEEIVYDTAAALVCPKCRAVIQQFQLGVSDIDILKAINSDDPEILSKTIYCSKCGQKLKIFRPMPVEVDCYVRENNE